MELTVDVITMVCYHNKNRLIVIVLESKTFFLNSFNNRRTICIHV